MAIPPGLTATSLTGSTSSPIPRPSPASAPPAIVLSAVTSTVFVVMVVNSSSISSNVPGDVIEVARFVMI